MERDVAGCFIESKGDVVHGWRMLQRIVHHGNERAAARFDVVNLLVFGLNPTLESHKRYPPTQKIIKFDEATFSPCQYINCAANSKTTNGFIGRGGGDSNWNWICNGVAAGEGNSLIKIQQLLKEFISGFALPLPSPLPVNRDSEQNDFIVFVPRTCSFAASPVGLLTETSFPLHLPRLSKRINSQLFFFLLPADSRFPILIHMQHCLFTAVMVLFLLGEHAKWHQLYLPARDATRKHFLVLPVPDYLSNIPKPLYAEPRDTYSICTSLNAGDSSLTVDIFVYRRCAATISAFRIFLPPNFDRRRSLNKQVSLLGDTKDAGKVFETNTVLGLGMPGVEMFNLRESNGRRRVASRR